MKFLKTLGVAVVSLLIGGVAVVALSMTNVLPFGNLFGGTQQSETTLTVTSLSPKEEIALVSIGIQGLDKTDSSGRILGMDVPAGSSTTYIPFKFDAKFGVDGEKVVIKQGDVEGSYTVVVPEFIVIGTSEVTFDDPIEQAQFFGWTAPQVSQAQRHTEILSEDTVKQYIGEYETLLKDQTEVFYTRIITAIDPTVTLTFEFAE